MSGGLSGRSCQGGAECDTLENRRLKSQNLTPGPSVSLLKFVLLLGPGQRPGAESQIRLFFFFSMSQIRTLETLIGLRALYSDHVLSVELMAVRLLWFWLGRS